jgi:hypothetical protein
MGKTLEQLASQSTQPTPIAVKTKLKRHRSAVLFSPNSGEKDKKDRRLSVHESLNEASLKLPTEPTRDLVARVSYVGTEDITTPYRTDTPFKIDIKSVYNDLDSPSSSAPPSPREVEELITQFFPDHEPTRSPISRWKTIREDCRCSICQSVLIRPVDIVGCGHYVCKTHVIDLVQHNRDKSGSMTCILCRRNKTLHSLDEVKVDLQLWSKIQSLRFHKSGRKSVSPGRSLTPLQDRFNRLFFSSQDF